MQTLDSIQTVLTESSENVDRQTQRRLVGVWQGKIWVSPSSLVTHLLVANGRAPPKHFQSF